MGQGDILDRSTPQKAATGPEGECLVNVRVLIAVLAAGAVVATAPRHLSAAQAKTPAAQAKPAAAAPRLVILTAGDPAGEKMTYTE